ncbi:MAG: sugar ABC transporter permease [Chloroflexi bacterium]|nr:sugar ABC transporter permease [Chloroflexota bacterium]
MEPAEVPNVMRFMGTSWARRESTWGLLFLAPWLIGFALFFAGPMLASLGASFTDLVLVRPGETHFIGLDNWTRLVGDPLVIKSLLVTSNFLIIAIPIALALPLLMAVLLNSTYLVVKPLFRALFFLPVLIPGVAAAVIWQGVLNVHSGWVDLVLSGLGLPAPDWLNEPQWVIPALSLISTWSVGNAMVIMLAGLQNVPTELYDAAKVDGANAFYRFFKITIPMISPVIFYNLVLAAIAAFQYFLTAYVIYQNTAGPNNAALFYMMNLYKEAFVYYNMGYASALAWGLFIVGLAVTLGLFAGARRWVYYAGGDT